MLCVIRLFALEMLIERSSNSRQQEPRVALDIADVPPSTLHSNSCNVSANMDHNALFAHITRHNISSYSMNAYKAHWQVCHADYLLFAHIEPPLDSVQESGAFEIFAEW